MEYPSFLQSQVSQLHTNLNDENMYVDLTEDQIWKMVIYEIIVKTIPSIVFIITAAIRLAEIKSFGVSRVTSYSKMFIFKVIFNFSLALMNFILIVLSFAMKPNQKQSIWIVKSGYRSLSFVFLINIAAWAISAKLLSFEYKRGLSEAFYCHHLFWSLTLIIQIVILILNFENYVRSIFEFSNLYREL